MTSWSQIVPIISVDLIIIDTVTEAVPALDRPLEVISKQRNKFIYNKTIQGQINLYNFNRIIEFQITNIIFMDHS